MDIDELFNGENKYLYMMLFLFSVTGYEPFLLKFYPFKAAVLNKKKLLIFSPRTN